MTTVIVSPKFQIVIPKEIRKKLKLRPGQQMVLFEQNGAITAVPARPLRELRGIARGMSLDGLREKTERF